MPAGINAELKMEILKENAIVNVTLCSKKTCDHVFDDKLK